MVLEFILSECQLETGLTIKAQVSGYRRTLAPVGYWNLF
jgi:hypothetical protein